MANDNSFLGRGWSFPPTFDRHRREVLMLEGYEDIRSSLEIILATTLGERVMRPTFGWKRDRWLFESLTTTMATEIQGEIKTALVQYEPRIDLNRVRLIPGQNESGRVEIHIDYTVRATNSRENEVFPFNLTER